MSNEPITHANREAEQADIDADNDPGQDIALLANTLGKIEERLDDMGEAISRQNTTIRDQVNAIHERFGNLERAYNNLNETVAKNALKLDRLALLSSDPANFVVGDPIPGYALQNNERSPMQQTYDKLAEASDGALDTLDLSIKPEQVLQYERNGFAIECWQAPEKPYLKGGWVPRAFPGQPGYDYVKYRIAPGQEAALFCASRAFKLIAATPNETKSWTASEEIRFSATANPTDWKAEEGTGSIPFAGHSMMGGIVEEPVFRGPAVEPLSLAPSPYWVNGDERGPWGPVEMTRYGVERVEVPADNPSRAPTRAIEATKLDLSTGCDWSRYVLTPNEGIVQIKGAKDAVDEHVAVMHKTREERDDLRRELDVARAVVDELRSR